MKKLHLAYLLIFFSICLIIGYTTKFLLTYNNISNSFKITENKYDFLESSNLLLNNIRNLESFQRGFLLTKKTEFLDDYNKSKYQLNLEKERFYNLTVRYGFEDSNPKEIKTLKILIDQKITEMDSTITLENKGLNQEAINFVKTNLGVRLMNEINTILLQLNTENKYKETVAKRSIYKARAELRYTSIIIFSFVIFILVFLGFYIKNCVKNLNLIKK
jgi:CHASE3 domain sensor protein